MLRSWVGWHIVFLRGWPRAGDRTEVGIWYLNVELLLSVS